MELDVTNPEPIRLSASLMRGVLDVDVAPSAFAPESLFGFAERRNPKRAFLFVSRVLGKHIPVRPAAMQASYAALAAKIPADLPGPVLFCGMAETATGLAQSVWAAWRARHPGAASAYIQSSRQIAARCASDSATAASITMP